jgi:hypothetical protein
MRFTKYSNAVLIAAAALPFVACFETTQSCEDLANCAGSKSGGTGGTSAGAGHSGSGGAAAQGGGGETGAAGANAGSSNTAGKSGAGNTAGTGGTGGTPATGGGAGEAGGGGEGGLGGAGAGTPQCDPTKTPSEDTCVITEDYGVFVSGAGDDIDGNGSRSRPYATLAKAISKAKSSGKRLYACADGGSYAETLDLGATVSGLELYGGFACDGWTYSTNAKSRIAGGTPLGLHIENVTALHLEDFQIEAADATDAGGSSVGVFVVSSTDVVFRRVNVSAGKGKDGSDGTLDTFTYQPQSALNGNSESTTTPGTGGAEKACACQGTLMSIGGTGGPPASGGLGGGKGLPNNGAGQPGSPDNNDCGNGGSGHNGAAAPSAAAGPGATTLGTLSSSGWLPADGGDGAQGAPGQGGGGGASFNLLGHGGGGGCGGCGGNGANGGHGGGASIALLVVDSTIDIASSTLTSSNAGSGGSGRAGQPGQQEAGAGGVAVSNLNSCTGGAGGFGADGGASGGGAGGISVGILWSGDTAPVQNDLTFSHGTRGTKGVGGDPGVNDGINGEATDVKQAQ